MNVFRIYAGTEMLPWLNQIKIRSLVLTGVNDGSCNPLLHQKIARRLPDAELVILPKFKHSIVTEAADQDSKHLIDFMEKIIKRGQHLVTCVQSASFGWMFCEIANEY